jgi:hypothetical protein
VKIAIEENFELPIMCEEEILDIVFDVEIDLYND